MPSPRWTKVLRDVAQHRVRTMLVIAAMTVGLLAAGTILNTHSIINVATEAEYLATNPPSAIIEADGIDDELLAGIRQRPEVADAQARQHNGGMALVEGQWKRVQLFVLDEADDTRIGRIEPVAGAWPPEDGQLIIEQSSLDFARAKLGDELRLGVVHGISRPLPVTGIARDSGLAPGWMENVIYGFVTPGTIAMLGGTPNFDTLQIIVARKRMDEEHIRRVAFDVKAYIESTGRAVTDVTVPTPGRHIHAGQMDSLMFVQLAMGVLALALSGLLILNHMSAVLSGQVREIGVMKAVGARGGQIARLYLGQVVLLGLLASAMALPIALLIGGRYATFIGGLLNFDVAGYSPRAPVLWAQLAAGVLLPLVAAIVPVLRGARMTVCRALRDPGLTESTFGRRAIDRLVCGVGGRSRPALLALRNALRRPGRLALTLVALAAGGALFLGTLNLRATIRASVDEMFARINYDLIVVIGEAAPFDELERLVRSLPGVVRSGIATDASGTLIYDDGTQSNTFPISGIQPGLDLVQRRMIDGRWLEPGDTDALVINDQLLQREPGMRLGTRVSTTINGARHEWTIVGIVDTPTNGVVAYAERESLAAVLGEPGRGARLLLDLAATDLAEQREVNGAVQEALAAAGRPVHVTQLMHDYRVVREDHLLMVSSFLLIMSLLAVVVGGLGLATTMSLSVMERTREIGIMKAIGAAHRTIRRLVLVEGLCIGLMSWLVAIPLSVPMSMLVGNGFGRIMFRSPLNFVAAPEAVANWAVLVIAISALASFYPAVRATRQTTIAALACHG